MYILIWIIRVNYPSYLNKSSSKTTRSNIDFNTSKFTYKWWFGYNFAEKMGVELKKKSQ